MMKQDVLKKYLPMSEPACYILLSIVRQPKHGYAIVQEIRKLTENRLTLGNGTLYGAIGRLENDGIIFHYEEADGKKVYKATEIGIELLKSEQKRLQELHFQIENSFADLTKGGKSMNMMTGFALSASRNLAEVKLEFFESLLKEHLGQEFSEEKLQKQLQNALADQAKSSFTKGAKMFGLSPNAWPGFGWNARVFEKDGTYFVDFFAPSQAHSNASFQVILASEGN